MALNKVELCGVNTSKLPLLNEQEKEDLFVKIRQGDMQARETYIKGNLRLVLSVIKRFSQCNENADDLFQIGCVGLMKAVDHFEPERAVKFSTYAVPLIAGEIKRFLRDDGMVKVSRSIKENGIRVFAAREKLLKEKNGEPTLNEVAQAAGLTVEEVVTAMEANHQVDSIYRSVYGKDGKEILLVDQLKSHGEETEEQIMNRLMVRQLLKDLDETEEKLIRMRYFQNKTQTVVAKELGISQVQVSRMEKKILLRLRERMI